MDSILTMLNEYRILAGAVLAVLVTSFAIYKMWEKVSFWWLRVACHIPVIGKISRLSKNHAYDSDKGWFSSEREICAEFHPYYEKSDVAPEFFNDCSSYLRKVQETGRKKLSLFGWVLLAFMVFIEAMGFSYVLAGWTIPGATAALKEQGAFGIAILISGLLVFMTHSTGHELHINSLIKKVRAWYTQSGEQNYKMIPNNKVSLDNERVDDEEPEWRQLLSRLKNDEANVTPTYKITGVTMFFILVIAVGSTYVRGQTLESSMAKDNLQPKVSEYDDSNFGESDPYATDNALPIELDEAQKEADQIAQQASKDADRKGAWTTFVLLAFIFVFLQIMGILIGKKTGFAGKESSGANEFKGKFRTADEFARYHERKRNHIAQHAQKCLEKLQARMVDNAQNTNIDGIAIGNLKNTSGRSFYAYLTSIRNERYKHEEVNSQQGAKNPQEMPLYQFEETAITDDEIALWMAKLGWNRESTIDLLKKHKDAEKKKAVSEEDALQMLASHEVEKVSEEDAFKMLTEAAFEVNKA